MDTRLEVVKYIAEHWDATICESRKNSFIKLPKPYSTPCAADRVFANFYYWDTYFANLGLMLDGRVEQAENNLEVMAFFVDKLGYVPNADTLINRTQPPLFARGVYDLYQFTKDKTVIERYLPRLKKEMLFFEQDRTTPCGLNAYKHNATKTYLLDFYKKMQLRLGLKKEQEIDKLAISADLLAIAESGWDFNPRFMTENNRFAASEFAHLDLNCLLYDAEIKIAEMAGVIEEKETAEVFLGKSKSRKKLIDELMYNQVDGLYYDYRFTNGQFSKVLSCASLYPYALGISNDATGLRNVLKKLELPFGVAACEDVDGEERFQWGYPSMWPSNVYFAVTACINVGEREIAQRIAKKYTDCVERCFAQTGSLWEKYDASVGKVSTTKEYKTPEMMGWTAGVYLYLIKLFQNE